MRILVTGCTRADLGVPHELGYVTALQLLVESLRSAGHEVDQRFVVPSDRFKEYDRVFVGLYAGLAWACVGLPGALWALRSRSDAMIVLNDWQIGYTYNCLKFLQKNPKYFLHGKIKRENATEWISKLPQLLIMMGQVESGKTHRILIPTFPWGDRDKLPIPDKARELARYFDPSALVPYRSELRLITYPDRKSTWLLAALADHRKWVETLDLVWPVEMYGNKKIGLPRITETELAKRSYAVRGSLSFPYPHAGSGWWRVRIVYTVRAGTMLAGCLDEMDPMGSAFSHEAGMLEGFEPKDQWEVARLQRLTFEKFSWSKRQMTNFTKTLLEEVG